MYDKAYERTTAEEARKALQNALDVVDNYQSMNLLSETQLSLWRRARDNHLKTMAVFAIIDDFLD